MNQLSPDEIEIARRKVLRNAIALLRDARLLFKHRRYPRAYALAHLASEEIVKLPMLVRAGLQSQTGPSQFDWRTLGQRLLSHKAKLRQAAVSDYMLDLDMANDRDLERLKTDLASIGDANDLKNRSLYSGVADGRFMSRLDQVGDKDVPRRARCHRLGDAGPEACVAEGALDAGRVDGLATDGGPREAGVRGRTGGC